MSLRRTVLLTIALALTAVCWSATPAGAVDNPDYTSPPPSTVVTTPVPARQVETAVNVAPARTRLAITGSEVTGPVVVALGLIAVGTGALVVRKRRVPAS